MSLLDEFLRSPNGSAYQREEVRHGPPLDYVAETLRSALESHHALIGSLRDADDGIGSNRSVTAAARVGAMFGRPTAMDELHDYAMLSFNAQVTAWLALKNMLGSSGTDQTVRLASMSRDDFERWLDMIDREGSVSGE